MKVAAYTRHRHTDSDREAQESRKEGQNGKKKYRKKNPQEKGKFRLCIDGMPILEWFKMKFQELKEKLGVSHTPKEENTPKRGLKM